MFEIICQLENDNGSKNPTVCAWSTCSNHPACHAHGRNFLQPMLINLRDSSSECSVFSKIIAIKLQFAKACWDAFRGRHTIRSKCAKSAAKSSLNLSSFLKFHGWRADASWQVYDLWCFKNRIKQRLANWQFCTLTIDQGGSVCSIVLVGYFSWNVIEKVTYLTCMLKLANLSPNAVFTLLLPRVTDVASVKECCSFVDSNHMFLSSFERSGINQIGSRQKNKILISPERWDWGSVHNNI